MSKILARARRSIRGGGPQIDDDENVVVSSPTSSATIEEGNVSPIDEDGNRLEKKASGNLDGKEKKEYDNDKAAKVEVVLAQQTEGEIKYKTMSWKKCAAILFGEYVCLAIISFPWAFKTLGE